MLVESPSANACPAVQEICWLHLYTVPNYMQTCKLGVFQTTKKPMCVLQIKPPQNPDFLHHPTAHMPAYMSAARYGLECMLCPHSRVLPGILYHGRTGGY